MKWYFKGWMRTFLAFCCMLTLILSSVSVLADDDISTLEEKTSDLQKQLDELNSEMVSISDEISSTEMQIELANSELLRMQDRLSRAQEDEEKQYEDMKIRIKFMYETGSVSLLELLFSAESMADFLNKAEFIQNVSSYDRSMLTQLSDVREEIAAEKESLQTQQEILTAMRADLETQKEELAEKAENTSTDLDAFTKRLTALRAEEARRLAEEEARLREEAASQHESESTEANTVPSSDPQHTVTAPATPSSNDDLILLAGIIECEAYQQYDYLLAVCTVIMNRLESPRFPNTIRDVIYAPGQFSSSTNGAMDRVLRRGPSALSLRVAQDALNGSRLSSVADCYYFLWAGSTRRPGVNVGDNLFFAQW